ncbi:hypothetical protein JTE90_020897 [Oedothorax gibbosus]|uniref:Galactose mutarotase n=1 Tax=Oedothorax gibbosus TaxID=931172 RepID=A0AAV6VQP1_9ARAC|nr:hypothetical protein JTE90_020897 [Oedothorax gibbosus]
MKQQLHMPHRSTLQATPISTLLDMLGYGNIDDHVISINADSYLPIDETGIPTGIIKQVSASAFDLREPKSFKVLLGMVADGFDHNFCINGTENLNKIARVYHPKSGISMHVTSTQPGVQLYTANFLPEDDSLHGKDQATYKKHSGFCLETQNYPNAINQVNFPRAYIDVGEVYEHTTKYLFTTVKAGIFGHGG